MAEHVRCRHCDTEIEPCECTSTVRHWQDAGTPAGIGSLHCPGEPHQPHEPNVGNG